MSGCPYWEFNWKKDCEVCSLTKKCIDGSLTCDFDYDECRKYKRQQAKLKRAKEKK